jgi:5'-nucleotidase
MIDFVFIDVGNVLFNDDPQNFHAYRLAYERIRSVHADYSFERMLAEREELAAGGSQWNLFKIIKRHLCEKEAEQVIRSTRDYAVDRYDENHLPNDGVPEVLERLRSRWRLGIIANQMPECRRSLSRRGLLEFFDVVAISEEINLHKPDVAIFNWAITKAGCDASRAAMIGDRHDNDIVPARSLAMKTVLVRWPDCRAKGWNPDDPLARAFLDSCDRVPLFSALAVGPGADRTMSSLRAAPEVVASLTD